MRKLIVSTCGTSLLTNCLKDFADHDNKRALLNKYANTLKPDSIQSPEDRASLQQLIDHALEKILAADIESSKALSAELSGLFIFDQGKLDTQNSQHWLIPSDTWLGQETAAIIQSKLEDLGVQVLIKHIPRLRTDNIDDFNQAASELARLCHEEIKPLRERIIFNLSGGFKGVQGYLQALGTIYADESIYTFERTSQLIRLPRLPMRLEFDDVVRDNLRAFRRMNTGLKTMSQDIGSIPNTLLFQFDGEYELSSWGQVLWNESHETIYEQAIHPSFDDKLDFADSFIPSTESTSAKEKRRINERIDQLIQYLHNDSKNPKGLDFKPLRGKHSPWTHECDAWQDGNAKRLFGHFEGGRYILDHLDMPLH